MAATIRAAVIGLAEPAQTILEALRTTAGIKLVSLADADKERLAGYAESPGLSAYDDHRIMLVETRPQIVFVNMPRYQDAEVLALAAELGIHAWKPCPLGRTFEEAAGFVQLFAKANLALHVGSPLRFSGGFAHVSHWLGRLGRVHLIHDQYMVPWASGGEITGWRASRDQAGGGVLLEGGYPGLEMITSQFGLPEQVYCLSSGGLGGPTDRPYETEDLTTLSMSFAGGMVACSVALRVAAQASRQTVWHGASGRLTYGPGAVAFKPAEAPAEVRRFRDRPPKPYARQVHEIVQVLRGEQPATSTGKDHLPVMAVIQAAYLSARTGQPESPSQFYELQDLTPPAPPVISSPVVG